MLTGACLSRAAGFPARVRYATAACVIGAELPDADYVYRLGGPLMYFQHHRGWTHALWSLPLQAAFVVLIFWVLHRTRRQWKRRRSADQPASVNWLALGCMTLLALLTHILLDWTNNYGVRPFAPFNARWYEGDLVYIVEPLLLVALGLALLLPLLFSLVHREIGVRRTRYSGQALAAAALLFMVALWGYRAMQREDARTVTGIQEFRGGPLLNASFGPYPVNPYQWHVVANTRASYQSGTIDTRVGIFVTGPQQVYAKLPDTPVTLAAKQSWLGRVYLNWSQFPLVKDAGTAAEVHPEMNLSPEEAALRVVTFDDLRFRYDAMGLRGSSRPVLRAEAWVDGGNRVVRAFVGGSEQTLR